MEHGEKKVNDKRKPPSGIEADSAGGKGHKELSKKRSFGVCLIIIGRKNAKNFNNIFKSIKSSTYWKSPDRVNLAKWLNLVKSGKQLG